MNQNFDWADYVIDEYALEGYNMDTAKAIRTNPKTKELIDDLKRAKTLYKEAKKMWKRDPDTAISKCNEAIGIYTEAIKKATEFKKEIDALREPGGKMEKFLSGFTPLFMWKFPEKEYDHTEVSPGMYMTSGGGFGTTLQMTAVYNVYEDKMSKETMSKVKQSAQQRMNLFIKNCKDQIATCTGLIDKIKQGK